MMWLREYVANTELPAWLSVYPLLNYWADTEGLLGWVNTREAPWIYTAVGWGYAAESTYSGNGMWLYLLK